MRNYLVSIPHAVSSAVSHDLTYDCSGNMITRITSGGTQAMIYDAENHMVEVKLAEGGIFSGWGNR
jgi:YD repeat-containing protein